MNIFGTKNLAYRQFKKIAKYGLDPLPMATATTTSVVTRMKKMRTPETTTVEATTTAPWGSTSKNFTTTQMVTWTNVENLGSRIPSTMSVDTGTCTHMTTHRNTSVTTAKKVISPSTLDETIEEMEASICRDKKAWLLVLGIYNSGVRYEYYVLVYVHLVYIYHKLHA